MARARRSTRREIDGYLVKTSNLGNAILYAIPVLVIYNVGLLIGGRGALNGADFLTGFLYSQLDYSGYVGLQAGLIVVVLLVGGLLARKGRFDFLHLPVLMAESLAYALTMGTLILFVMNEVHLLGPSGGPNGLGNVVVVSAGAGFYEELVFRLGLLTAFVLFLKDFLRCPPLLAFMLAIVGSSVLFSLAHYAGSESFAWFSFWYRALAGGVFAAVFLSRGFAAAVYTHFLYDVYVMMMR